MRCRVFRLLVFDEDLVEVFFLLLFFGLGEVGFYLVFVPVE
jgi:hypothetical protein